MSLSEVSNALWRERRLLELLLFKLEEEQLVLASGRTRWLPNATREVETILEEIKIVQLERAIAIASAAGELGTSDAPSLRELTAIAPSPWNGIFTEHRRVLLLLERELDIDSSDATGTISDRSPTLRLVSVQSHDSARISQAGVNADEEDTTHQAFLQ